MGRLCTPIVGEQAEGGRKKKKYRRKNKTKHKKTRNGRTSSSDNKLQSGQIRPQGPHRLTTHLPLAPPFPFALRAMMDVLFSAVRLRASCRRPYSTSFLRIEARYCVSRLSSCTHRVSSSCAGREGKHAAIVVARGGRRRKGP